MIINTDNNLMPAGAPAVPRPATPPVAAIDGREVRGTGPSANHGSTVLASVRQVAVSDERQAAVQEQDKVLASKSMEEVADALNRTFGQKQSLQFSVDRDTGVNVIKVMQSGTGEVVRQIPNEEALMMLQKLETQQDFGTDTAVLFDQMA